MKLLAVPEAGTELLLRSGRMWKDRKVSGLHLKSQMILCLLLGVLVS